MVGIVDGLASRLDSRIAIRTFVVQLILVALVAIILALLLPKSFFESWGWLSGPTAWLACAWATSRILSLPAARTVAGAVLVGIPSVIFVILGLHWLGALVAALLLGLWCAIRPRGSSPSSPSPTGSPPGRLSSRSPDDRE